MNTLPPLPAPAKFRKLPVVIDASQWFKNGDHPLDYAEDTHGLEGGELRIFTGAERKANDWEGAVVRYFRHPDVPGEKPCEQCGKTHHVHGWIDTLEQGHRVCPGDWIITGVAGEMYPCKPLIFAATYEPALAAIAAQAQPEPYASDKQLQEAHRLGFLRCVGWAQRDDLFADVDSPTYRKDQAHDLATIASRVQPVQPTPPDVLAALCRVVAADDAHTSIHAADGDDVARMVEWAAAFDEARETLALHGIGSPGAPNSTPKDLE